jgi:hypothetical protein
MERRQSRALKQLLLDTEEEKTQMEKQQQDLETTKKTKRQRTNDPSLHLYPLMKLSARTALLFFKYTSQIPSLHTQRELA